MNTLEFFGFFTLVFLQLSIKSTRTWRGQPPPREFPTAVWMVYYYVGLVISSVLVVTFVSRPSTIRPMPAGLAWFAWSLIALAILSYLARLGRWAVVWGRLHTRRMI
jgi:hypothetical protein